MTKDPHVKWNPAQNQLRAGIDYDARIVGQQMMSVLSRYETNKIINHLLSVARDTPMGGAK